MTKKTNINAIDKHAGTRLRMRRLMMNMTQTELADAVGISFQQVQKYETGFNRISASRLQQFASVLRVPVTFFFDGAPTDEDRNRQTFESPADGIANLFATADGLAIARAFMSIKSPALRRSIAQMVGDIADNSDRARPKRRSVRQGSMRKV